MVNKYYCINKGKWMYAKASDIHYLSLEYKNCTFFQTIESWDENNNKSCPIYADFDGESAQKDAIKFIQIIREKIGEHGCYTFYSGSKGFHVIFDYWIKGEDCERVLKDVLISFSVNTLKSWDSGMYKSRNMWRKVNTRNENSDLYKVQITENMLQKSMMYEIKTYATSPRKTWEEGTISSEILDSLVEEISNKEAPKIIRKAASENWKEEITPCIACLLETPAKEGERHYSIVVLARFFKYCNADVREGIEECLKVYPEYDKHVTQVFHSVYKSNTLIGFGCANNDILKAFCKEPCKYRRKG